MEYVFLDKVSSTQDYIKNCLFKGKKNIAVLAKIQDNGRGRRGREWKSPEGGLWFSFDTEIIEEVVTLTAGVAAYKACVEEYDCELEIKWPNDLILNGRKIAGILCEKFEDRVIIGIGVNTNTSVTEIENSISFISTTEKRIDNINLMKKIISEFKLLKKDEVIQCFRENMAFVGERKYVSSLNKEVKIIGVSDEGHLVVEDNEIRKQVFIGEILIDGGLSTKN